MRSPEIRYSRADAEGISRRGKTRAGLHDLKNSDILQYLTTRSFVNVRTPPPSPARSGEKMIYDRGCIQNPICLARKRPFTARRVDHDVRYWQKRREY